MKRSLSLLTLAVLPLATGCAASLIRPTSPQAELGTMAPQAAGFGGVSISVRWPSYVTQAIPLSASALNVSLLDINNATVATASIARPNSSASLQGIAAGAYTVAIAAKRPDMTDVADATSSVSVVANRVATASLTLVPKFAPTLTQIYPTSGFANTAISLYGTNLAAPAGGTYSVFVDGQAVPTSLLQPGNTPILTSLPAWASAAASISISVDGISIPVNQTQVFNLLTIDHITLSPSSVTISKNATQSFTATAYQDAGGTQPLSNLNFTWSLANQIPPSNLNTNYFPYSLMNGYFQATASATGSVTVQATVNGSGKTGTASVTIQ